MSTKLQVDIVADARGVGPGVNEAESRFKRLGGTIGRVGKLAAVGLAGGLAAAGAAAFKLAQGAAEDEAAAAKLANALNKSTGATRGQVGAVEDWITAQGKALGVTDDELRPAIEKLASSTGSLKEAQKQASLAMDVAAGRGVSLEVVTKALERANNGSVTGLSRLGVATQNAAGKTLSLEQVTKNMARTYRGAASTAANTTAGRYKRLQVQMGEMGETIGAKLLPIANKLAGWALRMIPAAGRLGASLGQKLGPAFRAVGAFITGKVVPAARSIYGWFVDKIAPGIGKYVAPILAGLRSAWASVAAAIRRNEPQLRTILGALRSVAEFIATRVMPVVGKLIGEGFQVLGKVIGTSVNAVGRLTDAIGWAIDKVASLIQWFKDLGKVPGIGKVLDFVTGSAGGLVTVGHRLVGPSPSLDRRAGWASAAGLPPAGWASSVQNTAAAAGRPVVIDARLQLTLPGATLMDEVALVRRLTQLQEQHRQRLGNLAGVVVA